MNDLDAALVELKRSQLCQSCFNPPQNTVLLACGHAYCDSCSKKNMIFVGVYGCSTCYTRNERKENHSNKEKNLKIVENVLNVYSVLRSSKTYQTILIFEDIGKDIIKIILSSANYITQIRNFFLGYLSQLPFGFKYSFLLFIMQELRKANYIFVSRRLMYLMPALGILIAPNMESVEHILTLILLSEKRLKYKNIIDMIIFARFVMNLLNLVMPPPTQNDKKSKSQQSSPTQHSGYYPRPSFDSSA